MEINYSTVKLFMHYKINKKIIIINQHFSVGSRNQLLLQRSFFLGGGLCSLFRVENTD